MLSKYKYIIINKVNNTKISIIIFGKREYLLNKSINEFAKVAKIFANVQAKNNRQITIEKHSIFSIRTIDCIRTYQGLK